MSGFCDAQGRFYRFKIPQFTDQYYVRILSQSGVKRIGKACGVRSYLTLIYQTLLMTVDEFDWVFNRENVCWTLTVNLVQQCGERSGFPRACRTGNENQAIWSIAKFNELGRQVEFIGENDIEGYCSKDNGDAVTLIKYIHAKAGKPLDAEREIYLVAIFEVGFLRLTHETVGVGLCVFGRETQVVGEFAQIAVNSYARR